MWLQIQCTSIHMQSSYDNNLNSNIHDIQHVIKVKMSVWRNSVSVNSKHATLWVNLLPSTSMHSKHNSPSSILPACALFITTAVDNITANPSFQSLQGSPSCGGDVAIYVFSHNPSELAHPFLFCSCSLGILFRLYGPFNCILFHKFSWQLSAFSSCSSGLISALLVLLTIYLCLKVTLNFLFTDRLICMGLFSSKEK